MFATTVHEHVQGISKLVLKINKSSMCVVYICTQGLRLCVSKVVRSGYLCHFFGTVDKSILLPTGN